MSTLTGNIFYVLFTRRRRIALDNLRRAFKNEKDEKEIKKLAKKSCASFLSLSVETFKLTKLFSRPDLMNTVRSQIEDLDKLFVKAKKIHDESGGCIFVTPHIGNWEALPYVSSLVGIPVSVVVRPLDNEYLEKSLYANRIASGQVIIPRKKAFSALKRTLREGRSLGLLPDQSSSKGISVNFFGRKAYTTPIPAILAIWFKKPIVVVACCRKPDNSQYEGIVCDPIWPEEYSNEKAEVFRLTQAMNEKMESIIRKYPEQYLWFHNRWKEFKGIRDYLT